MNSSYCSLVQKPMTRSTTARLYQDRSNSTISPAVGNCDTYRWKYHCPASRSVGFSRATTRAPRGLRCSVNRLTVPLLPAASLPSKTITPTLSCGRLGRWTSVELRDDQVQPVEDQQCGDSDADVAGDPRAGAGRVGHQCAAGFALPAGGEGGDAEGEDSDDRDGRDDGRDGHQSQ